MLVRNTEQMGLSRERDSFAKHWHGYNGTAVGGTVSLSVLVSSSQEQIFVSDISFRSSLAGASMDVMNGTAYLYHMKLDAAGNFNQQLATPMKTSQGTNLNIHLYGIFGTSSINIHGYTVK